MGSGDPYLDAQTGLTYSLYKPVNTLGLPQTAFKVLVCGGGGEELQYSKDFYGGRISALYLAGLLRNEES